MKTKITLTVEGGIDAETLRQLLRDAIGEFKDVRGPTAETYVRRRYKLDGKAFERKVAEVFGRVKIAQELRSAVDEVVIEYVDE